MSQEIVNLKVDTYNEGIELLAQQMQSKLRSRVREENKTGERNNFPQIGAVAARKRTVQHEDTKYINTPHKRRWVGIEHFDVADLVDLPDLLEILENPGGEYTRTFLAALNREHDENIVQAMLGTAFTGKQGTDPVPLPAGQQIPAGGTGFTLAKVKAAMKLFKKANAVDDDPDLTIAWTAEQEDEFLDTTEVKSHDFNTQRVLVAGGMGDNTFYGFNYVRLEDWTDELGAEHQILPKTGSVRSCVAWLKGGVLTNVPQSPMARADQLPTKKYSWQYFASAAFDSTRLQETHVVQIDAEE